MGVQRTPLNVNVYAGSVGTTPLPVADDNQTNKGFAEFQIAAGNAYETRSSSLRCHSGCVRSPSDSSARQRRRYVVPEFWTLVATSLLMTLIWAALVIGVLTWLVFYCLERKMAASERVLALAPIAFTVLLVAWTVVVSPFSKYGDNWAVMPAVALAPIVIAWHLSLLGVRLGDWACRRDILVAYSVYGFVHLCIFAGIWLFCLMKISKDSL